MCIPDEKLNDEFPVVYSVKGLADIKEAKEDRRISGSIILHVILQCLSIHFRATPFLINELTIHYVEVGFQTV